MDPTLNITKTNKIYNLRYNPTVKGVALIIEKVANSTCTYTWEYSQWITKRAAVFITTPYTIDQMDKIISNYSETAIGHIEYKFEKNDSIMAPEIHLKVIDHLLDISFSIEFKLTSQIPISYADQSLEIENKWRNFSDMIDPKQNQQFLKNTCQIKKGKDNIVYLRGRIIPDRTIPGMIPGGYGLLPTIYRPQERAYLGNDCEINPDGSLWLSAANIIEFDKCQYFTD